MGDLVEIPSGKYLYSVSHPDHPTVEVVAEDRLHALVTACNGWMVRWPTIATECTIDILGEAPTAASRKSKKRPKGD